MQTIRTKRSQETAIQVFYLILVLQILENVSQVGCTPQTGVIPGGFVGLVASTAIAQNSTNTTQHHQSNITSAVPHIIVPATTVERTETLGNGCFKQTVKQPDYSDPKRFISTEQLICPHGVNVTSVVTQQFHKPLTPTVIMPIVPMLTTQPVQPNNLDHPVTAPHVPVVKPPTILPVPINATHIAVLPPPAFPTAPMPAVITQQKHQPDVFHPRQPVVAEIPNVATSQVIVLSKKTGYYDTGRKVNAATTMKVLNAFVIVALWPILNYCLM